MFWIVILSTISGCNPYPNKKTSKPIKALDRMQAKELNDLQSLDSKTYTDAGSFWLLSFKNDSIVFDFTTSCGCQFKAKSKNENIEVLWPPLINCPFELNLLNNNEKLIPYDSSGVFAILTYIDDSTLHIKYYNESWLEYTNESNQGWIDSLFPTEFHKVEL